MLKDDYIDKKDINSPIGGNITTCQCSSLITTIIGTSTDIMRNYILSLFPKGFFKTVYVDTKLTTFELEEDENIYKKSKPILIISPKIVFKEDTQLQYIPDWTSTSTYIYGRKDKFYSTVLYDENNGNFIYAVPDRLCIDFDITMIFSTKTMQINSAYHLKQSMHQLAYTKLRDMKFDSEIPKYIIHALALSLGIDMTTPEGINNIVSYLNNQSFYSISRKKNLSNGRIMYTFSHKSNIIFKNENFPELDDGNESEHVKDDFRITFTLNAEFWAALTYILQTNKKINPSLLDNLEPLNDISEDIITVYHSVQFAPVKDKEDKKLFLWESYITDENVEVDKLDIGNLLHEDLHKVINYCVKQHKDVSEYIIIDLFINSQPINKKQYEMNWKTKEICLHNPLYNKTYHFAGYVNTEKVNSLLNELNKKGL